MNADGTLKNICIEGQEYKGKALLDKVDQLIRTAYFDSDGSPEKDFALDYIWYLWGGKDSPLFDKSKMATFERAFIDDKEVQKEEKGAYYTLREEEKVCDMILDEFGVTGLTAISSTVMCLSAPSREKTRSRQTASCWLSTAVSPDLTIPRPVLPVIRWFIIPAVSSWYSTNRSCLLTRQSRKAVISVPPRLWSS